MSELLCLGLESPFAGEGIPWEWGEYIIGGLSAWNKAKPLSEICFTILMNVGERSDETCYVFLILNIVGGEGENAYPD